MHPCQHAQAHPDRVAFAVADTGATLSYRQLDEGSNRLAHLWRQLGLEPGDRIGVILGNCPEFPLVYWAAQRSGLLMALISTHLKAPEAAYILQDCGARALVFASESAGAGTGLLAERAARVPRIETFLDVSAEPVEGSIALHAASAKLPGTPVAEAASRVLELDPLTLEPVLEYSGSPEEPFFSSLMGTVQRLPGGNTLITESDFGRAFEVDAAGRIVWEFDSPHTAGENDEFVAVIPEFTFIPAGEVPGVLVADERAR